MWSSDVYLDAGDLVKDSIVTDIIIRAVAQTRTYKLWYGNQLVRISILLITYGAKWFSCLTRQHTEERLVSTQTPVYIHGHHIVLTYTYWHLISGDRGLNSTPHVSLKHWSSASGTRITTENVNNTKNWRPTIQTQVNNKQTFILTSDIKGQGGCNGFNKTFFTSTIINTNKKEFPYRKQLFIKVI